MSTTFDVRAALAELSDEAEAATAPVELTMKLSGPAAHLLAKLAGRLGRDRGETISEALQFLYFGVAIQKDGLQMAVVDRDGQIQTTLDLLPGD